MKRAVLEYELTKTMMSQVKGLNEGKEEDKNKAIPITNDIRFGQNVLKAQEDNFKKSVHNGAKFATEDADDAESNPLVFYPKTGNLIFSGSIPTLSDLKFQFSLNDVTNGPYIFVDGLAITEEVVSVINKLRGYYLNWKDEWLSATDLLEKLKKDYKDED